MVISEQPTLTDRTPIVVTVRLSKMQQGNQKVYESYVFYLFICAGS